MGIADYKKKADELQQQEAEAKRLSAEYREWEEKSKASAKEMSMLKYLKFTQKSESLIAFIMERCVQDGLEVISHSTSTSIKLGIKGTSKDVIYFKFCFDTDPINYGNDFFVYEHSTITKSIGFTYEYKNYHVFKSDENRHKKNDREILLLSNEELLRDREELLRDIERFKAEIKYDELVKNFVNTNDSYIVINGCDELFDDYEKFWKKIFD
jgi:hypothetical protein